MTDTFHSLWNDSFVDPSKSRLCKPRQLGLTMLIDKGIGMSSFTDILRSAAAFIDFIKLGFGTSALYPDHMLKNKIRLAKEHDIQLYPGGTFFEVAYRQERINEYFENVRDCGFEVVEISDGSISLSLRERADAIQAARRQGLKVITECGKKQSGTFLEIHEIQKTLENDLEHGAMLMIIEGRESGENVGIFDSEGNAQENFLASVAQSLGSSLCHRLIWEAPKKDQQVMFIHHFGPQVNLGNISPEEIYSLESLRRGLRADTFSLHEQEKQRIDIPSIHPS